MSDQEVLHSKFKTFQAINNRDMKNSKNFNWRYSPKTTFGSAGLQKSHNNFSTEEDLLDALEEFHGKLIQLRNNIKQEIVLKSIKGDTKINDLWNNNNFNNLIPD